MHKKIISKKITIMVLVALLLLFPYLIQIVSASNNITDNNITIQFTLQGETRRDRINNSGTSHFYNVRQGSMPHVYNNSQILMDLTPTLERPQIIDTYRVSNFNSLTTEIVWSALNVVLNNSFGKIVFNDIIDLSRRSVIDLDSNVNISSSYVAVNITSLSEFNIPAEITMEGLSSTQKRILKNGIDCPNCTIKYISSGTLIFDVSGLGIYQALDINETEIMIKVGKYINITSSALNITGQLYNSSYPSNIRLDIGNDSIYEYSMTGILSSAVTTTNLTDSLNLMAHSCTCPGCIPLPNNVTCIIPVNVSSATQGTIKLSALNLTQIIQNLTILEDTNLTFLDLEDYFYEYDNASMSYTYYSDSSISLNIGSENIATVLPAANVSGTFTMIINATNAYGSKLSNNYTVFVLPINDPPYQYTALTTISMGADSEYLLNLSDYFADIDSLDINYTAFNVSNNITITIDNITKIANISSYNVSSASIQIYFTVTDGLLDTNSTLITITVGAPICDNDGICESGETEANCPNDCDTGGEEDPCEDVTCSTFTTTCWDGEKSCTPSCVDGSCPSCDPCTADPCEDITCDDSTVTCWDGVKSCANTCSDGECTTCNPCTADPCSPNPCGTKTTTCSDGSTRSCANTCSGNGDCSDCTPSCPIPIEIPPVEETPGETGAPEDTYMCSNISEIVTVEAGEGMKIPYGFKAIGEPFRVDCINGQASVTVAVPDNYIDLKVLRCREGICTSITSTNVTKMMCGPYNFTRNITDIGETTAGISILSLENINLTGEELEAYIREKGLVLPAGKTEKDETATKDIIFNDPSLLMIGYPMKIYLDGGKNDSSDRDLLIQIDYNISSHTDENNLALYIRTDSTWEYLGGEVDKERRKITYLLKNASDYAYNGTITIALLSQPCADCFDTKLSKVYSAETQAKNVLVLVHGLGSSSETFQQVLTDIKITRQEFDVWTFDYTSNTTIDDLSAELADQMQTSLSGYDNIAIVAHSLGGLVSQQALYNSYLKNKEEPLQHRYIRNVRKVVLVAVPNEGSIAATSFKRIYNLFLGKNKFTFKFLPDSKIIDLIEKGIVTPQVPGIDYNVIAGTATYDINLILLDISSKKLFSFTEKNDGLVTVRSAQRIGDEYVNETCNNYWEINVTHTDIIDYPVSRKLIERIVAKELIAGFDEFNQLGRLNYFTTTIDPCNQGDTYIVIGKEIDKDAVLDETGCSCGNGVCGIGEDEINCPIDCARIITKKNICKYGKIPLAILLLITTILSLIFLYQALSFKLDSAGLWKRKIAIGVLLIIDIIYYLRFAAYCGHSLALLIPLIITSIILVMMFIIRAIKPKGPKEETIPAGPITLPPKPAAAAEKTASAPPRSAKVPPATVKITPISPNVILHKAIPIIIENIRKGKSKDKIIGIIRQDHKISIPDKELARKIDLIRTNIEHIDKLEKTIDNLLKKGITSDEIRSYLKNQISKDEITEAIIILKLGPK